MRFGSGLVIRRPLGPDRLRFVQLTVPGQAREPRPPRGRSPRRPPPPDPVPGWSPCRTARPEPVYGLGGHRRGRCDGDPATLQRGRVGHQGHGGGDQQAVLAGSVITPRTGSATRGSGPDRYGAEGQAGDGAVSGDADRPGQSRRRLGECPESHRDHEDTPMEALLTAAPSFAAADRATWSRPTDPTSSHSDLVSPPESHEAKQTATEDGGGRDGSSPPSLHWEGTGEQHRPRAGAGEF